MEGQENHTEVTESLSKPILKSNTGLFIPLNDESNTIGRSTAKLPRRRVSFAPEVTLHKIDFVPQYQSDSFESDSAAPSQRRETIAFIPSSSDSSSNEITSSQEADEKHDVGLDILQDSSEDEDEPEIIEHVGTLEVNNVESDLRGSNDGGEEDEDDMAPIQSAIPIPSTLPNETDEEITMEITEPVRVNNLEINLQSQETQEHVGRRSESARVEIPLEDVSSEDNEGVDNEDEGEMELTVNVGQQTVHKEGGLLESGEQIDQIHLTEVQHITEEVDMELTQSVGKQPISHIQESVEEEDMELTQSIGKNPIEQVKELDEHSEIYHDSLDDLFEEKSMEITQKLGGIQVNEKLNSIKAAGPRLSEIQFPIILENSAPHIDEEEGEEGEDMELTQTVDRKIYENTENEAAHEPEELYSEEEENVEKEEEVMELTQQVGRITEPVIMETKKDPVLEPHVQHVETEAKAITEEVSDFISGGKDSLEKVKGYEIKRKAEDDMARDSQPQKMYHSGTTSTIPLADVTYDSIDENSEIFSLVSLSQFLTDIGIKFYDDLEIGSQSQNRISISLPKVKTDGKTDFSLEDYVMGAIKIPVYELNEFSCKELIQNIQEGIKIFETINESTSSMNPRLFKEFYETIPEAKLSMKTEFQLIKDYSRQEAKKIWYGWRSQLIRNVLDELTTIIEKLKEDRSKLLLGIEQINEVNDIVFNRHRQLKLKLANFKELASSCESMDSKELQNFQTELKQNLEHIAQFKREFAQQSLNLKELNKVIAEKEQQISKLNAKISFNSDIIQRNKKYNTSEINLLIFKFNLLQSITKSRIVKTTEINETKLVFDFDSLVKIIVDFSDKGRGALHYEFKERSPVFKMQDLYKVYSQDLNTIFHADASLKINEQFKIFRKVWQNLLKLDFLFYKISLKFPVVVERQSGDITIKYYIAQFKCKFELRLSLDVVQFSVKKLNIKVLRMGELVDTKKVLENFKRECYNNELVKGIEIASWE